MVVDGAEGGAGAAPLEFVDHVGTPLTEGLITVRNALVGTGLRDRIRIGASGKVATGADIVKRLVQGADYTNAARAMMFAVGCIQSPRCHANTCPVGVATQDPHRARALHVPDKYLRVQRFQQATVHSAMEIMAALGATEPSQLHPRMLYRRISPHAVASYDELFTWLAPGQLISGDRRPEDRARAAAPRRQSIPALCPPAISLAFDRPWLASAPSEGSCFSAPCTVTHHYRGRTLSSMSNTSRIETREIADDDLDNVAGGLSISGSVNGLTATFAPGPNGIPILTGGSVKSVSLTVSDIPLGPLHG
ncbi:hypothetical protein K2224_38635 (plasmid) [Streptomyces sp. BHT-5-2]|nr:hypothetical protein K2224_38635 [Streptomyces sp. BHT-5-2]